MRTRALLVLVAAGAIGLAACGGDNSSSTSATTAAPAAATATTAAPAAAATTTATTAAATQRTQYYDCCRLRGDSHHDGDVGDDPARHDPGRCQGQHALHLHEGHAGHVELRWCLPQNWPAATVTGTPTAASGISASALGTITATDGSTQLTINNQPLYTFAADKAPGDTNGQGYQSIWWVVGPDGTAIKS